MPWRDVVKDSVWLGAYSMIHERRAPVPSVTVVTGANHRQGQSLLSLLDSVRRHHPSASLHAWDLGLCPHQRSRLEGMDGVRLRPFPFADYPPYFDVSAGRYAWKPEIIAQELQAAQNDVVVWLDPRDGVHRSLDRVLHLARRFGVYSPYSAGTMGQWTHPGMIERLNLTFRPRAHPLNAALVALDARSVAAHEVADAWRVCAHDLTCIAPEGSHRGNHRQDQAALSIIARAHGVPWRSPLFIPARAMGVRFHQDLVGSDAHCQQCATTAAPFAPHADRWNTRL